MKLKKILCVIICGVLTGCSMMPLYERPHSPVASMWPNAGNDPALVISNLKSRTFFNDARLRKLIEIALRNNRDLRLAALNVDLLRAQYRIGSAYGAPLINGTANGQRQRDILNNGDEITTGKYSLKLGVTSYELDLFGRVRSLKAQALESYLASEETRRSVQIALIAQVAVQYLTERALEEQLLQTQATLKSVKAYEALIKRSYEIGNTSELDMRSAQAQVLTARSNVANFERQRLQAENALVLLVGQPLGKDLPEPEAFGAQKVLSNIPADSLLI